MRAKLPTQKSSKKSTASFASIFIEARRSACTRCRLRRTEQRLCQIVRSDGGQTSSARRDFGPSEPALVCACPFAKRARQSAEVFSQAADNSAAVKTSMRSVVAALQ